MRVRVLLTTLVVAIIGAAAGLVGALAVPETRGAVAAVPAPVTLFPRGLGGYRCFRVPKLLTTKTAGTLLAFAVGKHDGCSDFAHIDMVVRRSTDNGRTWGPVRVVRDSPADDPYIYGGAPVLDRKTGRIVLFGRKTEVDGTFVENFVMASDDDGVNWRTVTTANDVSRWNVRPNPARGIQLERGAHAGRLVVATWFGNQHQVRLVYSDDGGTTWVLGAVSTADDEVWAGEPSLFERNDGSIYVLARNNNGTDGRHKSFGISTDGGATFTGDGRFAVVDSIVSPELPGSVLRLRSTLHGDKYNRVLMATPASPEARTGMAIRSSYNEGKGWRDISETDSEMIYTGPSAYSDMALLGTGEVALLFEAGDEGEAAATDIRYTYFTEEQIGLPDNYSGGVATPDLSGADNLSRLRDGAAHTDGGRFDSAVTFNGTSSYVQVPFAESLAVDDGDFTVMAWIRYDVTASNRPIFWAYNMGDLRSQLWLRAEPHNNRIVGHVQSGSAIGEVASTQAYNDDRWHHVALQRAGATLRLYVDGAVVATNSNAPTGTVSPGRPFPMEIGRSLNGAGHFAGMMDEVRLYKRALTSAEMSRIHSVNAVDVAGAVLRLPFFANFPTTPDVSVNGNDGFVHGATTSAGRYGNGKTFDGVNDWIHAPYSNATHLGSAPFTVTTWFRYSGSAQQTLLWFYGVNSPNSQLWIRADPANGRIVTNASTPDRTVYLYTGSAYADNAWHFLALRRTATQLILTIDGTDVATVAAPGGALTAGHDQGISGMTIGRKLLTDADHLAGALDEIHIYTRALSAAELTALRTANTTPTNGLALHLPLNR